MKKDISSYLIRAKETLIEADFAFQSKYFNMSVSRAYYAMFYAVTAVLLSQGIERSKHSGVVSAFNQFFVNTGKFDAKFSKALTDAFRFRNINEYIATPIATEENSMRLLEDAKDLVRVCRDYCEKECK